MAAIGAAFVTLRRLPAFLIAGAAVVCAFAIAAHPPRGDERFTAWLVMTAGLVAWVAGFAIIRVMLIRSVSLQLMAHIENLEAAHFEARVHARLDDLRVFHLARRRGGANALTPLGTLIATAVVVLYRTLRITQ